MATNRIGFNKFLKDVQEGQKVNLVVDSNLLIAYFDEVHSNHESAKTFLDGLDNKADVTFYTTVTTKSEFLDYQRRRFLTEGIVSLVQENKEKFRITPNATAKINSFRGIRDTRLKKEEAKDKDLEDFDSSLNYFRDGELKEIKKAFRARDVEPEKGWLTVCKTFLGTKLSEQEKLLDEFCKYLTTRDKEQKEKIFIVPEVDWNKATAISAETGMGYSDSMILNMTLSTNIENIATLDFDVIYAGAVSAFNKNILLPDNRIGSFKQILKKLPKN